MGHSTVSTDQKWPLYFISISHQNYSLYWQKLGTILENKELQKLEQSNRVGNKDSFSDGIWRLFTDPSIILLRFIDTLIFLIWCKISTLNWMRNLESYLIGMLKVGKGVYYGHLLKLRRFVILTLLCPIAIQCFFFS